MRRDAAARRSCAQCGTVLAVVAALCASGPHAREARADGPPPAASASAGGSATGAVPCARPDWACYRDFARTELEHHQYVEAASHLAYALSIAVQVGTPQGKQLTEDLLAKAKANVGTLKLKISPANARVRVGETVYGPTDYREMVFVEPGDVMISAGDASGYLPVQKQVHIDKGETVEVELSLAPVGGAEPIAGGSASAGSIVAAGPNKVVLGAGIGMAVAGLAIGAGLLMGGIVQKADADTLRDGLLKSGNACTAPATNANCYRFVSAAGSATALTNSGGAILMGAGVVGAATLVYALLARAPATDPPVQGGVAVTPVGVTAVVRGRF